MSAARREWLMWLAGIAPAVVLFLHASAIQPLAWERRTIASIEAGGGFQYASPLRSRWMSQEVTGDSPARLLEDGRPLTNANAGLDYIKSKGAGRYALRLGALYFSASDNSDPRSNGRRYELILPWEPPLLLLVVIALLAIAMTVRAAVRNRTAWRQVMLCPPFWLAAAAYLLIALLARLWFLLDVRVPGLYGDSTSYYALVRTINEGRWPEFAIRTPGYPLFLEAVLSMSDTVTAVMIAQNLLTVAASLTLVYAFHVYHRALSLWAAIGMGAYTAGVWIFDHDTSLLSDSPYAHALIFAMAFLLIGLTRRRALPLLLSALAMAAAILFRPAGMFLFIINAIGVVFLWWNHYRPRAIAALAVPLPAIMVALALYNYATINVLALTAFGESQIGFATFTFWEDDPSYPPNVSDAVRRTQAVMRTQLSDDSRALLRSSWDVERLAPVFLAGFHYPALVEASTLDGRNDYMVMRHWVRRVSLDSIAKHPQIYLKFVVTQLWLQYFSNPRYRDDFIAFVNNRIRDIYVGDRFRTDAFSTEMAKEWAARPSMPGFTVTGEGADAEIAIRQDTLLRRLSRYVQLVRYAVFGNTFWSILYFVSLFTAPIVLWRRRCRHVGAFMAVVLTLTVLGASLIIALVEYGGHRYSAIVEFVYYLPLLPMMFMEPRTS